MSAAYEVRWGLEDGPPSGVRSAGSEYRGASGIAHDAARMFGLVTIHDGWTEVARWAGGAPEDIRSEVPGHPEGCSCCGCKVRAAHLGGDHETAICAHRVCRTCGTCEDCDFADTHEMLRRQVIEKVSEWQVQVLSVQVAAVQGRNMLSQMQYGGDENFKGETGDDAHAEFDVIDRALRNLQRIAAGRLAVAENSQ